MEATIESKRPAQAEVPAISPCHGAVILSSMVELSRSIHETEINNAVVAAGMCYVYYTAYTRH